MARVDRPQCKSRISDSYVCPTLISPRECERKKDKGMMCWMWKYHVFLVTLRLGCVVRKWEMLCFTNGFLEGIFFLYCYVTTLLISKTDTKYYIPFIQLRNKLRHLRHFSPEDVGPATIPLSQDYQKPLAYYVIKNCNRTIGLRGILHCSSRPV